MFRRLDHIGIVVQDLDAAISMYTSLFGFSLQERERFETHGMEIARVTLGDLSVELMQSLSEDGTLARFLRKRGPGIHHLAYEVEDIVSAMRQLQTAGLNLIDREPRVGGGNALIAFAHPNDTGKVLIEICQRRDPTGEYGG